jgi:glycosyltransferase involved in cell wall biosynthesis
MLDDWAIGQRRFKKSLYLRLVGRRFLEDAAFVHCTGEAEAAQSKARFPRGREGVVPLPLDFEAYRTLPGPGPALQAFPTLSRPGAKILFLSRVVRGKGLEALIAAAGLLRDRGVEFTLLVAGPADPGYRAVLVDLIGARRLHDHVAFLGMVGGVEKVSLYEACDVFVLASEHENFGLVIPEAMACRTPAVTTRRVGIWPELQRAGTTIVEPTPAEIAGAVKALLDDPDRRSALGEQGRAWVMEALSPEHLTRQYQSLYARAIAEHASRRADTPMQGG